MKLDSIKIKNYRSVEDVTFDIKAVGDTSFTYGFIGVNEAGKSSLLKAMALKDLKVPVTAKDYKDKTKEITVTYVMSIEDEGDAAACFELITDMLPEDVEHKKLAINDVAIVGLTLIYSLSNSSKPSYLLEYSYGKNKFTKSVAITEVEFNHFLPLTIFWSAKDEYLISKPINLTSFSANPETSIPLRNCFLLAGIKDIKSSINSISGDSTEKEALVSRLGEAVTKHIKSVWPDHPIKITFDIDGAVLNFHIKDTNSKDKAKTADQRSDGFKQFISFLLTVSAEDRSDLLEDCLLLLDEPETHLHPKAQIDFLNELKKITTNSRNNTAIFATHSNYMIDKDKLSRNFKVIKNTDSTSIELIDVKNSSYASVNYEVFGIPTTDYHNELYGSLHEKFIDGDLANDKRERILTFDTDFLAKQDGFKKNKPWKGNPNQATLSTYVRNCIHHPGGDNTFSDEELLQSIALMRKLL